MIEINATPDLPNTLTVNVEDAQEVRNLTHHLAVVLGEDICVAFREFLANVRDHCARKEVDVVELPTMLIAYDHGGGIGDERTQKPDGEGGYGLLIMRALGAEVRGWEEGTMFVMLL
jgi:nitrate/nitrite-specific signal transduction histidine kinase